MFGYLWVFNDLRYAKTPYRAETPFLGRFSTVIEPGWMVLRLRDSEARDLIEAAVGGALPDKAPGGCKEYAKMHGLQDHAKKKSMAPAALCQD